MMYYINLAEIVVIAAPLEACFDVDLSQISMHKDCHVMSNCISPFLLEWREIVTAMAYSHDRESLIRCQRECDRHRYRLKIPITEI
jgi:hypothetical protein